MYKTGTYTRIIPIENLIKHKYSVSDFIRHCEEEKVGVRFQVYTKNKIDDNSIMLSGGIKWFNQTVIIGKLIQSSLFYDYDIEIAMKTTYTNDMYLNDTVIKMINKHYNTYIGFNISTRIVSDDLAEKAIHIKYDHVHDIFEVYVILEEF